MKKSLSTPNLTNLSKTNITRKVSTASLSDLAMNYNTELVSYLPTTKVLECAFYDVLDSDEEDKKEIALCMSTPPSIKNDEDIIKTKYEEERFIRFFRKLKKK
jgi:hypothetical protein